MFDVFWAENSTLREKVLEHVFLSDLAKALLLRMRVPLEVLRSEFDAHGYDVVIEAAGVVRHVQLKATRRGGKRASVDVSRSLAKKPGGCVVWFAIDEATLEIGPFWWLGGAAGDPLPALMGKSTRHSRGNSAGEKAERSGLVEVAKGGFAPVATIEELVEQMFGVEDHGTRLRRHLVGRGHRLDDVQLDTTLPWDDTAEIAHMVDGYELSGLSQDSALDLLTDAERRAGRERRWGGSALELWVLLFLSHRRARFTDFAPGAPDIQTVRSPLLDNLWRELATAVRIEIART